MVIVALVLIIAIIGLLAAIELLCRDADKKYKDANAPNATTEPMA